MRKVRYQRQPIKLEELDAEKLRSEIEPWLTALLQSEHLSLLPGGMSEEIRIYVADLAAYHNGKLHGVWIDATQELDDIRDQINVMLAESPEGFAEEYAIHDYEGLGGELLSHFGGHLEDARKAMEENYSGCYKSLADYAEELTEGTSQIPENLVY